MLVFVMLGSLPCITFASPTYLTGTRTIYGSRFWTRSTVNFTQSAQGSARLEVEFKSGVVPNVIEGYVGFKFLDSEGHVFGTLHKTTYCENVYETGVLNPIDESVSSADTTGLAESAKGFYKLNGTNWSLEYIN